MSRRTQRPSKHESGYGKAIDELRNKLRDGPAFEAAKDWAIDFCKKVQQKDWHRQTIPAWDSGSSAARKLAVYLEQSADHIVATRLHSAAKESGVALNPDPPIRWSLVTGANALRKFMRELSKQPRPQRDEMTWYVYSPIAIGFRPDEDIVRPRRPLALAIGLTHGFRYITESRDPRWMIAERLSHDDPLKRSGGRPCREAAAAFANATFPREKATSADAVKHYIKRRRSIRFWWFGDKQPGK